MPDTLEWGKAMANYP